MNDIFSEISNKINLPNRFTRRQKYKNLALIVSLKFQNTH